MCLTPDTSTIPGLFQRLIRSDFPERTKHAQLIWATWTLLTVALSIGGCIAYRIASKGDVGTGAVASFIGATGPLAVLAGASFRAKDTTP